MQHCDNDQNRQNNNTNNKKNAIVLFKGRKCEEGQLDPYELELGLSHNVIFYPILQFDYCNQDTLQSALLSNNHNNHFNYNGIIVTSQRSLEAIQHLISALQQQHSDLILQIQETMKKVPLFIVGPSSAALAEKIGFGNIIAQANDAASLAHIIIQQGPLTSLLFLCGDRRRDELPEILKKNNIQLSEIIVYQTKESAATSLASLPDDTSHFVFFSPSGVEIVNERKEEISEKIWNSAQKIGIGKTTGAAMISIGWKVDGIPQAPSPQALSQLLSTLAPSMTSSTST